MASPTGEPRHFRRIFIMWLVASTVVDVLVGVFATDHLPPGRMSSSAQSQQSDFAVLLLIAIPVVLGIFIYLGYASIVWRARPGTPEPVGGEAARSNLRVQVTWMITTTVIVLALFVYGTVELIGPAGAGGGEGPNPIWTPSSKAVLPIQVIGQQWKFTYRYPTFGAFESSQLVVPVDTPIAFHVTSLDVIHSFWAYQLGVKADANPASDNVAFTTPKQLGTFTVRCSELCGLWHGAMFNSGTVVTKDQFTTWAKQTETNQAAATKLLPPFAWYYVPDANGADGGYYPDNDDPYGPEEQYGYGAHKS